MAVRLSLPPRLGAGIAQEGGHPSAYLPLVMSLGGTRQKFRFE